MQTREGYLCSLRRRGRLYLNNLCPFTIPMEMSVGDYGPHHATAAKSVLERLTKK